jgi:hypothetical protein
MDTTTISSEHDVVQLVFAPASPSGLVVQHDIN